MTRLTQQFLDDFGRFGPIGKTLSMPDQLFLQERLDYNQLTGVLTWRYRPLQDFVDARAMRIWNSKFALKRAGSLDTSTGYRTVSLAGCRLYEHRLIHCLMTGEWPTRNDHENHRRDDNRWVNLSDVSHAQNNRNLSMPVHNTSGVVGVAWVPRLKRWRAEITVGNKTRYLGSFVDKDDAVRARCAAEAEHGYHPNHGAAR